MLTTPLVTIYMVLCTSDITGGKFCALPHLQGPLRCYSKIRLMGKDDKLGESCQSTSHDERAELLLQMRSVVTNNAAPSVSSPARGQLKW